MKRDQWLLFQHFRRINCLILTGVISWGAMLIFITSLFLVGSGILSDFSPGNMLFYEILSTNPTMVVSVYLIMMRALEGNCVIVLTKILSDVLHDQHVW